MLGVCNATLARSSCLKAYFSLISKSICIHTLLVSKRSTTRGRRAQPVIAAVYKR